MHKLRRDIAAWANEHMELNPDDSSHYRYWSRGWIKDDQHLLLKLRLCEHETGADIVVLSCPVGYGADEAHWNGVNLGYTRSVEQVEQLCSWLALQAGVFRGEL